MGLKKRICQRISRTNRIRFVLQVSTWTKTGSSLALSRCQSLRQRESGAANGVGSSQRKDEAADQAAKPAATCLKAVLHVLILRPCEANSQRPQNAPFDLSNASRRQSAPVLFEPLFIERAHLVADGYRVLA